MTENNVRTSKYKFKQRLLVLLLSFVMIATYMPTIAFAGNANPCTDNPCEHVAAIGSNHYDSLMEAVKASKDGDTVEVLKNTTVSGSMAAATDGDITFYLQKSITLDLKGFEVIMPNAFVGIWCTNSNIITITDSTNDNKGKFIFGTNTHNVITNSTTATNALVVSGGNYNIDIAKNCADGYVSKQNDSWYTVALETEADAVASITRNSKTLYFNEASKAINSAKVGEQIVLLKDCSEDLKLKLGVTLNENGKKYTGTITKGDSKAIDTIKKTNGIWENVLRTSEGSEASVTVNNDTFYYEKLKDAVSEHNSRSKVIKLLKNVEITESDLVTKKDTWIGVNVTSMFNDFYATLDGTYEEGGKTKNRSITYTGEEDAYAFKRFDGKLDHVTFKGMNDAISFISGYSYDPVYLYVDVYGEMEVNGNAGAYVIYAGNGNTFENCTNHMKMTGTGFQTDYNAVFIGYAICDSGSTFNFTNCVNQGVLSCGKASMFVGNPALSGSIVMNVENCSNGDRGILNATYVDEKYNMNYYMAVDSNCQKIILNGEEINASTKSFSNVLDDTIVTNYGFLKNGPIETGMEMLKYKDNTFRIKPATDGKILSFVDQEYHDVAYYEFGSGLYVGVKDGSSRYFATEKVKAEDIDGYYKSNIKDYQFVDDVFVNGGETASLEGNKIFTKGGTTYYVVNEGTTTSQHQPENAEYYYISAFDANNKLLATVQMGEGTLEVPVAQIRANGITTQYATLSDALNAAKSGHSQEEKTIKVIGAAQACVFTGDCTGIVIQGSKTGSISGSFTVQGSNTILKELKFKDLKFVDGGNMVLSTATSNFRGLTIEGCTFEGKGADSTPGISLSIGDADYDGIVIKDNVIKNYSGTSSSSIIINNAGSQNKAGTITIEGNKVSDIGHNGVQIVRPNGTFIIKNNEFVRNNSKDVLNLNSAKKVVLEGNKFSLPSNYSSENQAVWNSNAGVIVDATNNTFIKGDILLENISDVAPLLGASEGKYVAYDTTKDAEDKLMSGFLVSSGTALCTEGLADECNTVKIGDTGTGLNVFIIGKGAEETNNKLTAGEFVNNPVAYVAEGYSVKASGDKIYSYEVYEEKTPKKEVVTERIPETEVGEEVPQDEKEVAQAVLEKVDVTGVAAALTKDGQSQLIKDAEETNEKLPAAVVLAKQIDIDISVEVVAQKVYTITATEATEKVITFDLKPYAIVTAISEDGSTVSSEKVLVENDYLSKNNAQPITVVLGTTFEPEQVVHIHGNGDVEAYHSGDEVSYKNRTYVYTALNEVSSGIVTLEVLDFSEIKLLAREMYATVSFDANGGSGSMESKAVEKGTEFTLPENGFTAPSGKEFKAWFVNGEEHAPGYKITVTADTEVKALWKDAPVQPITPSGVSTGDNSGIVNYTLIGLIALMGIALALTLKKRFNR